MRTRLERAQNQAVKIDTHIRAHSLSSNYLKNLLSVLKLNYFSQKDSFKTKNSLLNQGQSKTHNF